MERNYFIEGLFVLLGLALIAAVVKYPKDAFVKLPLGIFHYVLARPILRILSIPLLIVGIPIVYFGEKYNWRITPTVSKLMNFGTKDKDDKPHKATKNLKVDFKNGDKYLFVISSTKDLKELITDFLEVLTGEHSIADFKFADKGNQKVISFPKNIGFYDYHLLVQYFNGELGDENSFGVFKSSGLQYYVFQDKDTLNNLVGFTTDMKYFSIYMLDDLDKKQYLKLNQKLNLDTDWIERVNGTTANNVFASSGVDA